MIFWKIPPNSYQAALEQFLGTGAPVPDGLESLGRWHAPGSMYGWHLVEGDATALAEHAAEWAGTLELQITPVIGDEEAGTAVTKVFGK
jgi:hypothetical protein